MLPHLASVVCWGMKSLARTGVASGMVDSWQQNFCFKSKMAPTVAQASGSQFDKYQCSCRSGGRGDACGLLVLRCRSVTLARGAGVTARLAWQKRAMARGSLPGSGSGEVRGVECRMWWASAATALVSQAAVMAGVPSCADGGRAGNGACRHRRWVGLLFAVIFHAIDLAAGAQRTPAASARQKSTAADSCSVRGADCEIVPYEATPAQ